MRNSGQNTEPGVRPRLSSGFATSSYCSAARGEPCDLRKPTLLKCDMGLRVTPVSHICSEDVMRQCLKKLRATCPDHKGMRERRLEISRVLHGARPLLPSSNGRPRGRVVRATVSE